MFPDESPCPIIAHAFALFRDTKPETFADLLVEHLEEHGWKVVRTAGAEPDKAAEPAQAKRRNRS